MKNSVIIAVILFVMIFSLNISSLSAGDSICGPPKPAPSGAEELRMEEAEFDIDRALKSLEYLKIDAVRLIDENENKIFRMIKENNIPKDKPIEMFSVLSNEQFYIGYPNSISLIKGTLLKYRVLYLKEKMKNTSDKITISQYQKAKKEYCDFVSKAEYVD